MTRVSMAAARHLMSGVRLATAGWSSRSVLAPALRVSLCVSPSARINCLRQHSTQPAIPDKAAGEEWIEVPPPGSPGRLHSVDVQGGLIRLEFAEERVTLALRWLRDSCPCPRCVSPSSGQKTFASPDVPVDPKVASSVVTGDGELEVTWADDLSVPGQEHTSLYPIDLMVRDYVKSGPHYERGRPRLWNKKIFGSQPKFTPYADWMDGGDGFRKALSDLDELGLIFLSGVPQSESAVEDIVSKVGHLQSTFYGLTWDVISKPDAENVAYTNEFLGLHHDLMYIDSTPEIQILHCLDNDAEGGESLFSDGLRAALEVRHTAPDQFHSLSTVLVPYKYAAGSNHYRSALPVFDLVDGKVRAINWSPPFQDVFHRKVPTADGGWRARETPAARLAKWWSAAKAFKDNLEAPENMLEYKLRPGECVLFNNRRVLHGRRHFDLARGRRWLKGGYIEHKVFLSKLEDSGVIEENPLRGLPEEDVQARAILGLPLDEGPAEAAEATSAGKPGGKAKGGDNSARQVSDQSIETTSAEEARWGSDRDGNPRPIIRFVDPKGYGKGPRKSKRPEGGPAVESQA